MLDGFDLTIPAGTSMAIVGVNGAGKTTLAKLLCRLYDPGTGAIEIDGIDLRELDLDSWRARLAAVFQDFVRYERTLADNVAPHGADLSEVILGALADAGASRAGRARHVLARRTRAEPTCRVGSGNASPWPGRCSRCGSGRGVVLLDEPTAQLDVRGEQEIFERVLAATRHCTTILVSHRFSTVRLADRICVVEHGRVVELGSHDELMALGGRYRTCSNSRRRGSPRSTRRARRCVHETLA